MANTLERIKIICQSHDNTTNNMRYEANIVNIDDKDNTNYKSYHKFIWNFRELLWFWQEYYLRRGRDRLSIEFSSHIPFSFWRKVVGKLLVIHY